MTPALLTILATMPFKLRRQVMNEVESMATRCLKKLADIVDVRGGQGASVHIEGVATVGTLLRSRRRPEFVRDTCVE
jgi:hypothetical protein